MKTSFCILVVSLFFTSSLYGMNENEEDLILASTTPPKTVVVNSSVVRSSGGDFPSRTVLEGLRKIPRIALPRLPAHLAYGLDETGRLNIYQFMNEKLSYEIRIYGPDKNKRLGFVIPGQQEGHNAEESFAYAIGKAKPKGTIPVEYPTYSGYDRSHGIDEAHTAIQTYYSHQDSINFTPASPVYNQQPRRLLTRDAVTACGSYGEIVLYGENGPFLNQRHRLRPRVFTPWYVVQVPEGFIFKFIDQQGRAKIFCFPNQDNEFYPQVIPPRGIPPHVSLREEFEIRRAEHLLLPLILKMTDVSQERSDQVYRWFFMGLNLLPTINLSDALSFSKKYQLPVSWNGKRFYTQQQFERIVACIFNETPCDPDLVPKYPYWKNFSLPQGKAPRLTFHEVEEALIPAFPQRLANSSLMKLALNYLSLRLLEEAAKNQFDSLNLKLCLIDIYSQLTQTSKVEEWVKMAYIQALQGGPLQETVALCRLYFKLYPEPSKQWLDALIALVRDKGNKASVEELLDLENLVVEHKASLSDVPSYLKNTKTIGPHNSRILHNRILSPENVSTLVRLIDRVESLEKFSLDRAVFWVDEEECCRYISLTDEDYDIEPISTDAYFWEEEQPVRKIFLALKKHEHTLRKININNVFFKKPESRGTCVEPQNERLLRTIQEISRGTFINLLTT